MNIDDFIAGKTMKQGGYSSFLPESINHDWVITDMQLHNLLGEANLKLGELNAYAKLVPEIEFIMTMNVAKEATQSSKIEGTRTDMEEALGEATNLSIQKLNDWQEVQNYINALRFALEKLKELPLSSRLLNQTHVILLQGVRGTGKSPGAFRRSQNWIGGATLKDAFFVPPAAHEVPALMSDLELFLHNNTLQLPDLIRIGIAHYQFETIHPYLDGNGRLGRLLITLCLVDRGILSKPALYISDFFERNRSLYYQNLTAVRQTNNLKQWLRFFLVGVAETATSAAQTFSRVLELKKDIEMNRIPKMGRRMPLATRLFNYLLSHPVTDAAQVAAYLGITAATANRLIAEFETHNILYNNTGYNRNRVFVFKEYLDLFG